MDTILKPQQLNLYRNSPLEPQYVTCKQPNKAVLYLDSRDCKLETNISSLNASTARFIGDTPSNLAYGITRISLDAFIMKYAVPNVNERNNTFTFYSSASATSHTVTLTEGYYELASDLMDDIVTALNTVTGSSGLTFSKVAYTHAKNKFLLNSAGGNYYFDLNCTAVKKGYQLYCLPIDQTYSNSKVVGTMGLQYTRYIDICSPTITKYCKIKSQTTTSTGNLLFRFYFYTLEQDAFIYIAGDNTPGIQFYFNPDEPINTIQIELRDEFGELLYVPQKADGTYEGAWWACDLEIEC